MSEPAWTTESTNRILELLEETNLALSRRGIEINLKLRGRSLSYSTIKEHVKLAEASGLVEVAEEKGGWYQITDEGRAYLAGDLDSSDLEPETS